MKNRETRKRLYRYAKEDTPDLKAQIKASSTYKDFMETQTHMPQRSPRFRWNRRLAFGGTLALLILLFVFALPIFETPASSTVYMDINPSLRLQVGEDDRVVELEGVNEDGVQFLSRLENLHNKSFDDVLDVLIDEAIEQGLLSEANPYVMFDVQSENEDLRAHHLSKMEERLPEIAQARVPNFAMMQGSSENADEDELERAQQHGISVMKSRIIEAILEETDEYDFETLSEYSVGQLRQLLDDYDISPHRPGPPHRTPPSGP